VISESLRWLLHCYGERDAALRHVGTMAIVALVILSPRPAGSCSTFYISQGDTPVFAKIYDWSVDAGLLVVNKRGVSKVAMAASQPAVWTSTYGSVTFNQYGRELPSGGMNEAGLVVELMWLDDTEYAAPDSRPGLGKTQWIQYQLDNSATVDDVIASDSMIRIEGGGSARIHYLVADAKGGCASIEFLNGKLEYHTDDTLPWSVLTNHTYASSLEYLRRFDGFGGSQSVSASTTSLGRFVNVAARVARFEEDSDGSSVDYAFGILDHVAQGDYTKWSIVYDIKGAKIHFRTFANSNRRSVALAGCDFDCDTAVRVLDINAALSGDVTKQFVPYTYDMNRRLIEKAFDGTSFLKTVSSQTRANVAEYPEGLECVGAAARNADR
jgi:penicillin V acylase-like amidase (Ntn superfamily)